MLFKGAREAVSTFAFDDDDEKRDDSQDLPLLLGGLMEVSFDLNSSNATEEVKFGHLFFS